MKIDFKRIVRPLDLSGYAPEYVNEGAPVVLQVWVNPPRWMTEARIERSQVGQALQEELKMLLAGQEQAERIRAILEELVAIGQESITWLSEVLSQGPEETRMSVDEVKALFEEGQEHDPGLYRWIMREAWQMGVDYRGQKKKA